MSDEVAKKYGGRSMYWKFLLFGDCSVFCESHGKNANDWSDVCSAIMGVCTQIYQIKQLSLLMQTIIDWCIRYVSVISIGVLFGWFPFRLVAIVTATIIFIVFFLLFWTGFYLYERHQYQKFNRQKKLNP